MKKGSLTLIIVISFFFLIFNSINLLAIDQLKVGGQFYAFAPLNNQNPLNSRSFSPYLSFKGENFGVGVSFSTVKEEYEPGTYGPPFILERATRYEIDGKYYFKTPKPLRPYIGLGFISSHYYTEYDQDTDVKTKKQRGTAFNPTVGMDVLLQGYGLPHTTLSAGLNYFSPNTSTIEGYWLQDKTIDKGLTFHLAFKLKLTRVSS